jgi:hypothetical protein
VVVGVVNEIKLTWIDGAGVVRDCVIIGWNDNYPPRKLSTLTGFVLDDKMRARMREAAIDRCWAT